VSVSTVTAGLPGVAAVVPNYLVAALSNDFKASAMSGFSASSDLVQAVTWATCAGGTTNGIASETSTGYPGNQYYGASSGGGAGTYYAGAVAAAQAALNADPRQAQKVIILLSDGDANTDPNGNNRPCTEAVNAAQSAALAGTWIFSIAYDTPASGGCSGDTISAYTAMGRIARDSQSPTPTVPDPTKFFCAGTTTSQPSLPCQGSATLAGAFQSIGTSLTSARLYSDEIP
jgi:hypothetical protein